MNQEQESKDSVNKLKQQLYEVKNLLMLPELAACIAWETTDTHIYLDRGLQSAIGSFFYLGSTDTCFGVVKVLDFTKANDYEVHDYYSNLPCNVAEKVLSGKRVVYKYSFEWVNRFDEPRNIVARMMSGNFAGNFDYKEKRMINDITSYDASKLTDEVLRDDWRIVNAWYSTVKSGKQFKHNIEQVVNLASQIYIELVNRNTEFYPDKMTPNNKELFDIVSKGKSTQLSIEPKDIPPMKLIKDFISIIGSSVDNKSGNEPHDIDILIRMSDSFEDFVKRAIMTRCDKQLRTHLKNNNNLKFHFVFGDAEGAHDSFIPIYDLVLVPGGDYKIVEMVADLSYEPFKPFKAPKTTVKTYFEVQELLDNLDPGKYAIEKKYDGFRCLAHKKDGIVKLFSSNAEDITDKFPSIVTLANTLTPKDYIIDGELVLTDSNGKNAGRDDLIRLVTTKEPQDDSGVVFNVFDIVYLDKPVDQMRWYERKQILHSLNFNPKIIEVGTIIANNRTDIKKSVEMFARMERSEGAMLKKYDSQYPSDDKTSDWIKFKNLQPMTVMILDIHEAGDAHNFTIGVHVKDITGFEDDKIIDSPHSKFLVLGKTFNTSLDAQKFEHIEILVEEVWRHISKDDKMHYSIHKPRVVRKTNDPTSTIEYLDSLVVSRGQEVKELESTTTTSTIGISEVQGKTFPKDEDDKTEMIKVMAASEEGDGHSDDGLDFKDLPNRMRDSFESVTDWKDYVMQTHTIGDRLHYDVRHDVGDHLEGFTLFGRSVSNPIDIQTKQTDIRGTVKAFQPLEWLKVEGVLEPFGTKEFPGVFTIVSKGKYRVLEVTPNKIAVEYKSDTGKVNESYNEKAKQDGYPVYDKITDLVDISGCWSYHIAHIEPEKRILLVDKLKECPVKDLAVVDKEELDDVFKRYHDSVNMSYSELKEWSENPCSNEASLDRGPINRNLELLSTKKEDWTQKHVDWAKKTIAFIARMSQVKDGDAATKDCPDSNRTISLKNWAFNIDK